MKVKKGPGQPKKRPTKVLHYRVALGLEKQIDREIRKLIKVLDPTWVGKRRKNGKENTMVYRPT